MTQNPYPPQDQAYYPQQQKPQKSWFGRNWLWFLPTVILLPILCCCGGGVAITWFGMSQIFELAPYKDTLAALETNDQVVDAIGTPIDSPDGFGDFVNMMENGGTYNVNQMNNNIDFDARIPISGPNGSGTLVIVANSTDGGVTWTYSTRQVELDTGDTIYLDGALIEEAEEIGELEEDLKF